MVRHKTYKRHDKEKRILDKIRLMLQNLEWLVEITHGSKYMSGFPDLYLSHRKFGIRWVDVKVEDNYEYTAAQRKKWPIWHKHGSGIWIMTDATQEQYERLFQEPNWHFYWKPRYGDPFKQFNLDDVLDSLEE